LGFEVDIIAVARSRPFQCFLRGFLGRLQPPPLIMGGRFMGGSGSKMFKQKFGRKM